MRHLRLWALAMVAASAASSCASADDNGSGKVGKSQFVTFSDQNFKAYCVANFDKDNDGEISMDEARLVTKIEVCTDNIKSLQGVEKFPLDTLICNSPDAAGVLTSIPNDIDGLVYLDCSGNKFATIELYDMPRLECLKCSACQVYYLFLMENLPKLTSVDCSCNNLGKFDTAQSWKDSTAKATLIWNMS